MPYTVPPRSHTTPAMQHRISTGQHQRYFFGTQIKSIRRAGFRTKRPPISSRNYKNLAAHKHFEGCFKPGLEMTVLTLLQLATLSQHNSLLPSAQKRSESSALCIPPVKPNRDILPYRTPSTVPSLPLIQTHQLPPSESKTGRKPWSLLPVAEASPLPANSNKGLPSTNDQRDFEMGEVLAELSHLISINDSTNLLHIFDLLERIDVLLELYPDHQTRSYFPPGLESAALHGETPLQRGAREWATKKGCIPLDFFPTDGTTKHKVGFVLQKIARFIKSPSKEIIANTAVLTATLSGSPCLPKAATPGINKASIASDFILASSVGLGKYAASVVIASALEETGHSLMVGRVDKNHLLQSTKETLTSLATLAAFHAAGKGLSKAINKLYRSPYYTSVTKYLADNTAKFLEIIGRQAEGVLSAEALEQLNKITKIVGMSTEHLTDQKVLVRKYNRNFGSMARTTYERSTDAPTLKTRVYYGEIPHALIQDVDGQTIVVELGISSPENPSAKLSSPKITVNGEHIRLNSIRFENVDKGFIGISAGDQEHRVLFDHITGEWKPIEISQREINNAAMLSPRGDNNFMPLKILATDKQSFAALLHEHPNSHNKEDQLIRANEIPADIPVFLGIYKDNIIPYIAYAGFELPITRVVIGDINQIRVLDPVKNQPTEYIVRFTNYGKKVNIDSDISLAGCNRLKRSINSRVDCDFTVGDVGNDLTQPHVLNKIFSIEGIFTDGKRSLSFNQIHAENIHFIYFDINTGLIYTHPYNSEPSLTKAYKIIPIDNDKIRLQDALSDDESTTFTPEQTNSLKVNLGLKETDLYPITKDDYNFKIPNRVNMFWVGPNPFPHIEQLKASLKNTASKNTKFHIFFDSHDANYDKIKSEILALDGKERIEIHDIRTDPLMKNLVDNRAYEAAKINGYPAFLSDIARYTIQGTNGVGGVYIDSKHTVVTMSDELGYIDESGLLGASNLCKSSSSINKYIFNNDVIVTSNLGSEFLLGLAEKGLKVLSDTVEEITNHIPNKFGSSDLTKYLVKEFGVSGFSNEIQKVSPLARYARIRFIHEGRFMDVDWDNAAFQFTTNQDELEANVKIGEYAQSWRHRKK
ncbi:hypothetical protein [Vibrio aestuarianus]|uniref:Uncharacterized protein n=1 Tax=Vibrio aestuarianus TaxID=28171 RepID=A0ABD7YJ74_9VIBR|nr:hypothetical protein [Vibrio aestuarianus]WGK84514.1 hypothetical protein PYE67_08885 [Vibrio aestuarianus]CAH8202391.1 hypothetical protein VAEU17_280069 [Vibrio aestuarianus]